MAKLTVEWVEFNDDCERVTKSETFEGDKFFNFMKMEELMGDIERTGNLCSFSVKEEL